MPKHLAPPCTLRNPLLPRHGQARAVGFEVLITPGVFVCHDHGHRLKHSVTNVILEKKWCVGPMQYHRESGCAESGAVESAEEEG